MIKSFRHKPLRDWWAKGTASKLPQNWLSRLQILLDDLDAAVEPTDMDISPGRHFHSLQGKSAGRYAVNVTGNWRLTFGWDGQHAIDVDLEDYH